MRSSWIIALTVLATGCGASGLGLQWGADPGDFGNGRSGDLTVETPTQINMCWVLYAVEDGVLVLDGTGHGLDPGDLLLVWQVQRSGFATSGDLDPVTSDETDAGMWQLDRIAEVSEADGNTRVTLRRAPFIDYGTGTDIGTAQACIVPEHRNVTITETGSLVAAPWDGATGGVVAFLASDTTIIDGVVTASDTGFRGGEMRDPGETDNITDLDTSPADGGGKGEGLDQTSWALSGRGNYGNAAGGGNAHNAGGGGGGCAGSGGYGGSEDSDLGGLPATRGLLGAAVEFVTDRLVLGGGGGAGHQNHDVAGTGGRGGGVVLIYTQRLIGSGVIVSNGQPGGDSGHNPEPDGFPDGAGGGGAGGQVIVTTFASGFTGTVEARGGRGGDLHNPLPGDEGNVRMGPGGGGGGGYVEMKGWETDALDLSGGENGLFTNDTVTEPHGAEAGDDGLERATALTDL